MKIAVTQKPWDFEYYKNFTNLSIQMDFFQEHLLCTYTDWRLQNYYNFFRFSTFFFGSNKMKML